MSHFPSFPETRSSCPVHSESDAPDNVVDLSLYRRQREIAKSCVLSRVPLYVSHLDGQVQSREESITSRMASIDAQIEELDDLIYLLNQDSNFGRF